MPPRIAQPTPASQHQRRQRHSHAMLKDASRPAWNTHNHQAGTSGKKKYAPGQRLDQFTSASHATKFPRVSQANNSASGGHHGAVSSKPKPKSSASELNKTIGGPITSATGENK